MWRRNMKTAATVLVLVGLLEVPRWSMAYSSTPFLVRRRQERLSHQGLTIHYGFWKNFFEPPESSSSSSSSSSSRQIRYPEQYPATYERNEITLEEDEVLPEAKLVRQLLKNTQLESRELQLVYDANLQGWDSRTFHAAVDGKGAAIVVIKTSDGRICGGYNPKGWASLGGARPSVAAFLFYEKQKEQNGIFFFQKLQKVGGGGLACARDDVDYGISFGPDGLVIGLQPGRERIAQSKLGPYFERGPEDLYSIFRGGMTELSDLKILVGKYENEDDIPYSGRVLDMTSG